MGMGGFLFKLMYLGHLTMVIVGFGSVVVGSFLQARARGLDPAEGLIVSHVNYLMSKSLTTGPVVLAGVFGLLLVVLSDKVYTFSQTWVSIAFLLYFGVVGVVVFLLNPNARAIDELGTKLADGSVTVSKTGGPPAEVAEIEERSKKAAMYTGIVQLLWVFLLLDMIWKPGFA